MQYKSSNAFMLHMQEKSFKRDFKLHKIESSERLDSLMSRAKEHNDLMMLKTLNKLVYKKVITDSTNKAVKGNLMS
jgi:hypothetical protein